MICECSCACGKWKKLEEGLEGVCPLGFLLAFHLLWQLDVFTLKGLEESKPWGSWDSQHPPHSCSLEVLS